MGMRMGKKKCSYVCSDKTQKNYKKKFYLNNRLGKVID